MSAAAPSPIPGTKTGYQTLWSAQAAQCERLLRGVKTTESRSVAMLMLAQLKWSLQDLIKDSQDAWELGSPDSGRLADVMNHDFRKLTQLKDFLNHQ